MAEKFEVIFLKQAIEFVEKLDSEIRIKVYYNIDKAKLINDPKLFKKLGEIFGNSEQNIKEFNIGYLLFGTKRGKSRL